MMQIAIKEEVKIYITDNWKSKTDKGIADYFGYEAGTIKQYRTILGFSRRKITKLTPKEKIAEVIEMFCSGSTIVNITKQTGVCTTTASKLITQHFLYKKLNEDREVITLQSKINSLY